MRHPPKSTPWGNKITDPYPAKAFQLDVEERPTQGDIERFVRLWLTEGIPFAFRTSPMTYEMIREWIGAELSIHAKDVSMIGSARVGFSMAPHKYLKTFDAETSDLDFFAVSSKVFADFTAEFDQWLEDYESGYFDSDRTDKRYWDENIVTITRTRSRGFIDSNKIPAIGNYKLTRRLALLTELLTKHLRGQGVGAKARSLRIYKSWNSAVRQNSLNLALALERAGFITPSQ